MNVIFLDFDGVINNSSEIDDYIFFPIVDINGRKEGLVFSAANIQPIKLLMNFIVKNDIYLVVSSSWRILFRDQDLDRAFKEFLGYSYLNRKLIIGSTLSSGKFISRGEEIEDYIENNDVQDYMIIDDIDDFLDRQKKHVILTNGTEGFKMENYEMLENYFLKKRFSILTRVFKGKRK